MSETRDLINDTISVEEVVKHLGLGLGKNGRHLQGNCPAGHASQGGASFCVNTAANYFHCFHCGMAGDVVDLVELVLGLEYEEALRWLAEKFQADFPNRPGGNRPGAEADMRAYYQRASLYDLVFEYGQKLLFEEEGKNALEYLVYERGYAPEKLKQTDWMYFPPDLRIRDQLRKARPEAAEQIKVLKLQGPFEDNFRLAFPYRNRRGAVTGFLKRATSPQGMHVTTHDGKKHEAVRWDSTEGTDRKDLFNLHACKGEKSLILVEGYPDALYLPTQGIKGVAAKGKDLLCKTHVEGLKAHGVEMVTLCFDNGPPDERGEIAGVRKTEKALDLLRGTGIHAFVVDPSCLAPCKDPDQWVKERGIESFKKLLASRVYGSVWRWNRAKSACDLSDLEQWTRARNEGFRCAHELTDASERTFFLETLKTDLALNGGLFDEALREYGAREARKGQEAEYRDLHREIGGLLQEGKLDELERRLQEKVRALRARAPGRVAEPYNLARLQEDMMQTPEGLQTGYESLDQTVRIPAGALTIVAARPSQGKTAFLMNLLLHMVSDNPEKAFFFFSWQEAERRTALKLINILSGPAADAARDLSQIERYIRGGYTGTPAIEKAKQEFQALTGKGRLWIMDVPCIVEDLEEALVTLSGKHNVGAVFMDSLEQIRTKAIYPTRKMELQRISERLRETARALCLPLVLAAQPGTDTENGKPGDLDPLHEAGGLAQDAGLVIALHGSGPDKDREEDKDPHDGTANLRLTVLKNRNGPAGLEAMLCFQRPTLVITERGRGS